MSPADPARPPPATLSWSLVAVAFSPVLIDLCAHWAQRPWAAYSVVFLPLFLLELRRAPRGRRRPTPGWTLLGAALALELLLVAGGLTRAARLPLVLAAFGMGWIQGRPAPRAIALLVAFVPVPSVLVSWGSPALELAWAKAAAALLQLAGMPALVEAGEVVSDLVVGPRALRLGEADGGLGVAALLLGLAWYAGLRRGASIAATLGVGLACALLAAPIQILALASVGASGLADAPARFALDVGPWAVVAAIALLGPCRPGRAASRGNDEPLSSEAP